MKRIDLHAHFVTPEYAAAQAAHGRLLEDGFPLPPWSEEAHLAAMDALNIGTALLSVSSPHPWFGDPGEAAELARSLNKTAAGLKRRNPGRFLFAATLPLPDLSQSLEELAYACDALGADAVKIPTNAAGVYPGDARLDPLFRELDRRGTAVLLHPCAPCAGTPGCFAGRLLPLMEFLAETTRCVTEMLVSGTLQRCPNLKIVVPHCGAFLPNIAQRIGGITRTLAARGAGTPVRTEALRLLWYDIAGDALPAGLPILRTLADDGHLLFGSDYPYTPLDTLTARTARLEETVEPSLWRRIARENAVSLLGLDG